mmetsp:Transcript_29826/g.76988  ORF Transcript_29826/g.76988 Transcript_29826/m.76988 type:complete len:132 (-) Transcript_29826:86-481(-)
MGLCIRESERGQEKRRRERMKGLHSSHENGLWTRRIVSESKGRKCGMIQSSLAGRGSPDFDVTFFRLHTHPRAHACTHDTRAHTYETYIYTRYSLYILQAAQGTLTSISFSTHTLSQTLTQPHSFEPSIPL